MGVLVTKYKYKYTARQTQDVTKLIGEGRVVAVDGWTRGRLLTFHDSAVQFDIMLCVKCSLV